MNLKMKPLDTDLTDLDTYREKVEHFIAEHIAAHESNWLEKRHVPLKDLIRALGTYKLLGRQLPDPFGTGDYNYGLVLQRALARCRVSSIGLAVATQSDVVPSLITTFATQAQGQLWVPKALSGEVVLALAMTESGGGSDLQSMQTRAIRRGNSWVLTGEKKFITNGHIADLVCVLAKTQEVRGPYGFSLFLVPTADQGITQTGPLDTLGQFDALGALVFDSVELPETALLGPEHGGLVVVLKHLCKERMVIAHRMLVMARQSIDECIAHCKVRITFGVPLIQNQYVQFQLAEMIAECHALYALHDELAGPVFEGENAQVETAMLKLAASQFLRRATDFHLQMTGGLGYVDWHAAGQRFLDAPGLALAGGTEEMMLSIIAR